MSYPSSESPDSPANRWMSNSLSPCLAILHQPFPFFASRPDTYGTPCVLFAGPGEYPVQSTRLGSGTRSRQCLGSSQSNSSKEFPLGLTHNTWQSAPAFHTP